MSSKNPYDVIRHPVITEKASDAKDLQNKVVFAVDKKATKLDVKKAVEDVFKVKIEKVNILNVKPKPKRMGLYKGTRPGYKKAMVTLAKGDSIEVFDQV